MSELFPGDSDPFDALLAPPPTPGDVATLQKKVADRTADVIRGRRRRATFRRIGTMAACYLVGVLTGHGLPQEQPDPGEPPPLVKRPTPKADAQTPALALEWQAFDDRVAPAESYRRAGDRYLEEADPGAAVRCYSNALNAGPDALTISNDDNWLLTALKQARQKEMIRANRMH
jgi:hypothetical protein